MKHFYNLDFLLRYLFSIENELENYTHAYLFYKIRNNFQHNNILANLNREYKNLFKI